MRLEGVNLEAREILDIMPAKLSGGQVGVLYPLNWPLIWLEAPKQVAWSIGLHIALAGVLMSGFARRGLRLGWGGSLVAAIVFAFGGYLGAQVEHINQLNAAAWLPLLFLLYQAGLHRQHLHVLAPGCRRAFGQTA